MTTRLSEHGRGLAAVQSLPRHDRWVIVVVVLALAALILGFAASAPAFQPRGADMAGALDDNAGSALGATATTTTTLDDRSDK